MNVLDIELEYESPWPYLLNGIKVPRVTDILRLARKPFEQFLTPDDLTWYQSRGTAGHSTVEMLVKGTLDKRRIPKEIKPYIPSWDRTVAEYGLEVLVIGDVIFSELPIIDERYRFGTRIDLVMRSAKRRGRLGVWELKFTSTHSPATEKQTASHEIAVNGYLQKHFPDFREKIEDRFAVRLTENGKPDVRQHKNPSDCGTFLSYLNVYNDRLAHKII